MKRVVILVLAVLAAGVAGIEKAAAQRVELGVRAGLTSQDLSFEASDFVIGTPESPDIVAAPDKYGTDTRIGFHAAIVSRIRLTEIGRGTLGLGLFLQPEVLYTQNNLKMQRRDEGGHPVGKSSAIVMQSVEVPVMLSLKASIVRIQAGPVFSAVYKNTSKSGDIAITPIKPMVGYTAGLSVDIIGGLVIDGRYNGQFKQLNHNIKVGEAATYQNVRASLSSWSVGLSWLF